MKLCLIKLLWEISYKIMKCPDDLIMKRVVLM